MDLAEKSNNIRDLNSHIWDSWADEDGSIGKAYGYQLGVKHEYKEGWMDQVDRVLFDLKSNPFSRRIMTNIYVHQDLHEMNLYPCAYSMTFNVTQEKREQQADAERSPEPTFTGCAGCQQLECMPVFTASYDDRTGLRHESGELLHVIADAHIYDRHIPLVKELIARPVYEAPKVWLNPEITDFYDFTVADLHVEGYEAGPQIKNIPIAV